MRNEAAHQVPDSKVAKKMPTKVNMYHTLYPLEKFTDHHSPVFGYATCVYKATSLVDGKPYVLRRVKNYLIGNEASISGIEAWKRIRHSSIISMHEAFTTKAFGDTCIFFA